MKTKIGKKSIGLLIAAIIVASVVAAISVSPLIASERGDVKPMNIGDITVNASDYSAVNGSVLYWVNFTATKDIPQYGHIVVDFSSNNPDAPYDLSTVTCNETTGVSNVSLHIDGLKCSYLTNYTVYVSTKDRYVDINVTNLTGVIGSAGIPAGSKVSVDIENVTNSGAGSREIGVELWSGKRLTSTVLDDGVVELCIYAGMISPTEDACVGGNTIYAKWRDSTKNCKGTWHLYRIDPATGKIIKTIYSNGGWDMPQDYVRPGGNATIDITSCANGRYKFTLCPPGGAGCDCGAVVNFTIDREKPTLNWEYATSSAPNNPKNDTWYQCGQEINWNATADDGTGCGIENVTIDFKNIYNPSEWTPKFGTETVLTLEKNTANFYDYNSVGGSLYPKPFLSSWLNETPMQHIEVIAYDVGGNPANNSSLYIGVDCTAPGKTGDPSCNEEDGKIVIEWTAASDSPIGSGIDHYNVYGKHLNDSTTGGGWSKGDTFWAGRTIGPELIFDYTRGCPESETYSYYQFNITAVDKAGNEGPFSNYTVEEQQLWPGRPALIDITLKDDFLHASGQKEGDFIKANVTDIDGLAVADVTVKFNATLGMPCPPQNITKGDGFTYSAYHAPQSVLEPTITKICGWVAENTSIAKCVNLTLLPQQPTSINCTANPTSIDANQTTTNSTIVVQLMSNEGKDGEDHPVYGHVFVTLTTTAGTLDRTSGYTNDTGAFIANLSSTVHPAIATVTAYAGGTGSTTYLWKDSCTVAFIGPVTEFSIELYKGRNDISIPLWPEDTSCANVFGPITSSIDAVYHFDAIKAKEEGEEAEGWLVWKPGPVTWSLTDIIPGEGYEVWMKNPATLTITGTFLSDKASKPAEHKVVKGWNMIGFHSLNEKITPNEYITGGTTEVEYKEPLWSYHNGYRSTGYGNYEEEYMKPGWGYWVYITSDEGTIIPHWE